MVEWISIAALVVSVIVGIYLFVSRQTPLTAANVTASLESVQPLAQELLTVATIAVNSAEQLKNTGKIDSNDEAFNYALSFVKKWVPAASGIDNADIKAAIESAVLVANFMSEQIKGKPVATTPPAPHSPELGRMG